jgi:tRNA(Ile)-lysidine synthase
MVVAVSGGPDSVSLARALTQLQAALGFGPLILAHLNHQLRGEESDADEEFVADLVRSMQEITTGHVHLVSHRVDVKLQAHRVKDNLEKVAREARYSWLAQVARQEGAGWIATGHTANDQAETILHRLLRGSGLRGLRGIAEQRPLGKDLTVIRPMLDVTRSEVMEYLRVKEQGFRQDSSNFDRRFTRNRIRHELLPNLETHHNPTIVPVLCRLAEQAAKTYGRVEAKAGQLLAAAELPRAGALLIFDRRRLMEAPRSLVREVFRLAWSKEAWPAGRMGFKEWNRLAAVALGERAAVDLPGGIRANCRGRVVQLGPPS